MTPDAPQNSRQVLEARLTALLLGEVIGAEAATLHEILATDAELAQLYTRLQRTTALIREIAAAEPAPEPATAPTPPLQLDEHRRQKLLAHFKTVAPKEFKSPRHSQMSLLLKLAACATVLFVLAGLLLPALSHTKYRAKIGPLSLLEQKGGESKEESLAVPDSGVEGAYVRKAMPGVTMTPAAPPAAPAAQGANVFSQHPVGFVQQEFKASETESSVIGNAAAPPSSGKFQFGLGFSRPFGNEQVARNSQTPPVASPSAGPPTATARTQIYLPPNPSVTGVGEGFFFKGDPEWVGSLWTRRRPRKNKREIAQRLSFKPDMLI